MEKIAIELQAKISVIGVFIQTSRSLSSNSVHFRATLNKKVRNAQLAQYNFIFVVGEKEKTSGSKFHSGKKLFFGIFGGGGTHTEYIMSISGIFG